MSQASDANEKTASSVVAGKSLVGSSASPQAQPQGTPAAAISLKDASLAAAWDVAAEAIEQDLMRPVRYGGSTHWSTRKLAGHLGVSHSRVARPIKWSYKDASKLTVLRLCCAGKICDSASRPISPPARLAPRLALRPELGTDCNSHNLNPAGDRT
jgi:hypothetical protein